MASTFIFKANRPIILIDTSILYISVYLECVKKHTSTSGEASGSYDYKSYIADAPRLTTLTKYDYKTLHKDIPFLNKLEENFIKSMHKLLEIHKGADFFNVIFGRDTPLSRNWRKLEIISSYKAQRKPMEQYDPFVAQYFWNKIMPRFILNFRSKVLYYEPLEADDVIYLMTKRLREIYPKTELCIVTNDRDYLQLADYKTTIYKTTGKPLEDDGLGEPLLDKAIKILSGDTSDNIRPIYKGCGETVAYGILKKLYYKKNRLKENEKTMLEEKLMVDKQLLGERFHTDLFRSEELAANIFNTLTKLRRESGEISVKTIEKRLEENARLIDLDRIPDKYKEGFFAKYNPEILTRKERTI